MTAMSHMNWTGSSWLHTLANDEKRSPGNTGFSRISAFCRISIVRGARSEHAVGKSLKLVVNSPSRDLAPGAADHAPWPALLAMLVHLTGDESFLRDEFRPRYDDPVYGRFGLDIDRQKPIRQAAAQALVDLARTGEKDVDTLDRPRLQRILSFLTGQPVDGLYAEFFANEWSFGRVGIKRRDLGSPKKPVSTDRDFSVAIIGAGMSGLLAAIQLAEAGVSFVILEKNADVGGTWLENSYPGCRVDSPNHTYGYSFTSDEPWPQYFSKQPVLLEYFRRMANQYDLRRHIRFNTLVEELVWDDEAARWNATLRGPNGIEQLQASIVITAVGQLNQPKTPEFPGSENFRGVSFHSANWRHDVDLKGKRVVVIGTGASALQIIPEIAEQAEHLTVFQRSAPWRLPVLHYHDDVPDALNALIRSVPVYSKWHRFLLFWTSSDGILTSVQIDPDWRGSPLAHSAANLALREALVAGYRAELEDRDDLVGRTTPNYPIGEKRSLLDNGIWAKTLRRSNVELITSPVDKLATDAVVDRAGVAHPADAIIYATGFQASNFLAEMRVVGRDGRTLQAIWGGSPRAFLGMTVPGFPNFFMIYGPNTNIVVNGSVTFMSECAVRYILGCLDLLQESDACALEVRQPVFDAFNVEIDAGNAKMAWGAKGAFSWYKDASGRVSQNWPFALAEYSRRTLTPDPADFLIRPSLRNGEPSSAFRGQLPERSGTR